ncbi:MAG: precorrin-2 C(20)-methyltransferase [Proteobacteria bacterium]|nr:precorrin-2 C(20)-methyltransferase [Pseudomonadota bacterium]
MADGLANAATAYGLGVGPGDPELITVKALRLLRACPVVAYPAPEKGDSLARRIAAPHLSGTQAEIVIRMPLDAARFPAEEVYGAAADEIGGHLKAGRDVAILCQGDPFFYGSFMYLFARLAERYPVQVVPGVSSLTACAAALGAPLASRNDVLTVVPAVLAEDKLAAHIEAAEAAAIIKVGRHLPKVRRVLERLGLSDRAHYIEHATMTQERQMALDAVDPAAVPYFSMVLVHVRGEAWR